MEKEDGFFCATCKARQKAVKHLRIFRCPKILVLHLKRFRRARLGLGRAVCACRGPYLTGCTQRRFARRPA